MEQQEQLLDEPAPVGIHPTALVAPGAQLGENVYVGPYSLVGPNVVLGDGCRLHHRVTIDGYTTVGSDCEFFPNAVIGMSPQDLKYRGEKTFLEIGNNNVFREQVTAHPGTGSGGSYTRIGNNNHLLVGVHIAHDCTVGNGCIIANNVALAGHVVVEDHVTFGGQSAVHHFVTIGRHAMIGGLTRVTADVPPFMIFVAARTHGRVRFINHVGLKRHGFSEEGIANIKNAFVDMYSKRARLSGRPIRSIASDILAEANVDDNVKELCEFIIRTAAHGRQGRYLESLRTDKPTERRH